MNIKYRNGLERFYDRFPNYPGRPEDPRTWSDEDIGSSDTIRKYSQKN